MAKNSASAPSASTTAKSDPQADVRKIGFDFWGVPEREDLELFEILAKANPRAFWRAAKSRIASGQDFGSSLRGFCAGDERLVRLALRAAIAGNHSISYRHGNPLVQCFKMAMRLPGKSPAWREARAREVAPHLAQLSASSVFTALGACARTGALAAFTAILPAYPNRFDADKKQADRMRYGTCGYAYQGLGESDTRAWARATVVAEKTGATPPPFPLSKVTHERRALRSLPTNALFWCFARWAAHKDENPTLASAWGAAAATLVERGTEVEHGELLGWVLACDPMRAALVARPEVDRFGGYDQDRAKSLFEAFLHADPTSIVGIVAFDEAHPDPRRSCSSSVGAGETSGRSDTVQPIPAAALSMLAGHAPTADWASRGIDLNFKIPGKIIEMALDGSLSSEHVGQLRYASNGRVMTLKKLATAMGQPWPANLNREGPQSTAKKTAQTVPKP